MNNKYNQGCQTDKSHDLCNDNHPSSNDNDDLVAKETLTSSEEAEKERMDNEKRNPWHTEPVHELECQLNDNEGFDKVLNWCLYQNKDMELKDWDNGYARARDIYYRDSFSLDKIPIKELEKPESDSNAIKRHLMEKDIPVSDLKTEVSNMSVNSGEIRNGEHQTPNVPFTVMVTKDIRQEHKERQAEMEEGGDASP